MSKQTQQPPSTTKTEASQQGAEHHFQHEADKTELEKWLTAGLTKIEPYSNQILMGFIGIAVVLIAVIVWSRSTGTARSAEWDQFVANDAPEDYLAQAEKNPNSPVSDWALLQAGRLFLGEGMQMALTNREASDKRLEQAIAAFEKLIQRPNAPDDAREQALYGLASAQEVLHGNEPSKALETYKKLISEFPESQFASWVERRIAELENPSTQEFYAWFRQQNPSPTDFREPNDGLPQQNNEIPALENLDLLNDPNLLLPPSGVGAENTNTVPSEKEMEKKADGDQESAPKAFPAPGGLDAPGPSAEEASDSKSTPATQQSDSAEEETSADSTPGTDTPPTNDPAPATEETPDGESSETLPSESSDTPTDSSADTSADTASSAETADR